ncbi:hypothetical protein NHX12_032761 [Muraenolepis orangiensis]|uniref:Uncharacterized protein n=1 Tax=Muraenolepis orangiensis TaxID=630683 RepID=A0A9Q0IFQ7_9TELE|nr:hypothetical protein NHX12_032761 [Muraenolepis orangiensis]
MGGPDHSVVRLLVSEGSQGDKGSVCIVAWPSVSPPNDPPAPRLSLRTQPPTDSEKQPDSPRTPDVWCGGGPVASFGGSCFSPSPCDRGRKIFSGKRWGGGIASREEGETLDLKGYMKDVEEK